MALMGDRTDRGDLRHEIDGLRQRVDGSVVRRGKGGMQDWGGAFRGGEGWVLGTTGWSGQEFAFARYKGNARPAKGGGGDRARAAGFQGGCHHGKGKGASWTGRGVDKRVGKGRRDGGTVRKTGAYERLGLETERKNAMYNAWKVADAVGEARQSSELYVTWEEALQWHEGRVREEAGPRLEAALKNALRPKGRCASLLRGMPAARGTHSKKAGKWDNWYARLMRGSDEYCVGEDKAKMATIRGLVTGSRLNTEAGKTRLRNAVECVRGEGVTVAGSDSGSEYE